MVKLMPQINRIKYEHFGNNDLIADEQHKLFKREKYHPLLSLLPLSIQIFILLALIASIQDLLAGSHASFAGRIPVKDGGWTWLSPAATGISAVIFGWSQNWLNPLQREQSKGQQFATNAITVLISLFLGFFVSIGVAVYWVASNIFSIAIQVICNRVYPARKYVNYYSLRKSRVLLNRLKKLNRKYVTPADKKREKADYKRFFSVANKHLVFYSESSGFYKYYAEIISYLLKKSNVIIHYVTSDANDQIFQIAQENTRIRAYYIGDIKIISLFMKMDADIVVMTTPDLGNFYLKRSYVRKDIEYIYVDHAISSTHLVVRENAYDNFDTFMCVCEAHIHELRRAEAVYATRRKMLVPCGYGLLDSLVRKYQESEHIANTQKKILVAPSWQNDNLLDSCLDTLLHQLLGHGWQVILRPHPEYTKRFPDKWNNITSRYKSQTNDNFIIENDFSSNATIFNADLVITDWSGIAYEFSYATLKPTLFINTPVKILNKNYKKIGLEPINFMMRKEVGIALELDELEKIYSTVCELLSDQDRFREKIKQARSKYIYNLGKSGQVAGDYILNALIQRQKND